MDVLQSMELDSFRQAIEFMRDAFPWITLVSLLVTIVGVALAEKRKRKLVLEGSEEEERIVALEGLGDDEKKKLLKALAPLPESKEAYPLPDLPLRLVAALAKVFGLLKIILLLGSLSVLLRLHHMPDATWKCDSPLMVSILCATMLVFALMQVFASSRVTRGGNMARWFLIFMAVLDLGGIAQFPGMPFGLLWRGMIIGMSLYILWVLLLRTRAAGAVTHDFKPTRTWQKVAVLALGMATLMNWPIDFNATYTAKSSFCKLETSMSSSGNWGLPIRYTFLQAGDDSEETLELMRYLQENLEAPAELIEFGQAPDRTIKCDDLFLLVSKTLETKIKKPEKSKNGLNPKILKLISKQNPELSQMVAPQPSGDKKIAFEIETPLERPTFLRAKWRTKTQRISEPDLRINLSAEYMKRNLDDALLQVGASTVKSLNEYIGKRNKMAILSELPAPYALEPEARPAPDFSFITKLDHLAKSYTPQAEMNLYRMRSVGLESVGSISNQLVSAGWENYDTNGYKRDNEYVVIRGPKIFSAQYQLPHLYVLHAQCRKVELPDSYFEECCLRDFAEFIAFFQPKSVSVEVYREAMEDYLKNPELSAKEVLAVYSKISNWDAFKAERPALLYRFAELLCHEPIDEETFDLYSALGREITVERCDYPVYAKIDELYADEVIHLELAEDTNGLHRGEETVSGVDRPRLITFSKARDDSAGSREILPFYFIGCVQTLEDGSFKSRHGTPEGGGSTTGKELEAKFMKIRALGADHSGGSSWGSLSTWHSPESMEERMKSGDLLVFYEFIPVANELSLTVVLNDDAMTLSRTPDDMYLLDDVRMTPEELAQALKEEHERESDLGLVAHLSKAERRSFWKHISGIPRPAWIKYITPPTE